LSEEALNLLPFLKLLGVTTVHLLSVWEEAQGQADDERLKEASEKGRSYLTAYLQDKSETLKATGLNVEAEVRMGAPAEQLLRAADEARASLIAIATHGRTGTERWRLGSVADKVIRGASCPALIIGPNVRVTLEGEQVLVRCGAGGSHCDRDHLTALAGYGDVSFISEMAPKLRSVNQGSLGVSAAHEFLVRRHRLAR
jgi:nucleotide-binding universal stress UspA family protein